MARRVQHNEEEMCEQRVWLEMVQTERVMMMMMMTTMMTKMTTKMRKCAEQCRLLQDQTQSPTPVETCTSERRALRVQ